MSNEDRADVVTLYDEEGNEIEFEHLDSFELNEKMYVVLLEILENDEENDEVVILRLDRSDDGEENLIVIEDDEELTAAFEEFTMRVDDQFDFDYADSDEDEN